MEFLWKKLRASRTGRLLFGFVCGALFGAAAALEVTKSVGWLSTGGSAIAAGLAGVFAVMFLEFQDHLKAKNAEEHAETIQKFRPDLPQETVEKAAKQNEEAQLSPFVRWTLIAVACVMIPSGVFMLISNIWGFFAKVLR